MSKSKAFKLEKDEDCFSITPPPGFLCEAELHHFIEIPVCAETIWVTLHRKRPKNTGNTLSISSIPDDAPNVSGHLLVDGKRLYFGDLNYYVLNILKAFGSPCWAVFEYE